MLDEYQKKQPIIYKILKNAVNKDKPSHAYLFETNGFYDSYNLIMAFAKALLCPNKYTNEEKCQNCHQCHVIDHGNFPEIKTIKPEGLWIKKEELQSLQAEFSKKAIIGNKKIYIIKEADKLNKQAANSILKFLVLIIKSSLIITILGAGIFLSLNLFLINLLAILGV